MDDLDEIALKREAAFCENLLPSDSEEADSLIFFGKLPFADAGMKTARASMAYPRSMPVTVHGQGRRNGRVREREKPVFEKGEEILSAHDFIAGSMDDFVQKRGIFFHT